jgi:molybdenum cofactor cytidylyltransferase
MRFGPVPPEAAEGAILAHSLKAGGRVLKKGRRLDAADVAALCSAGIGEVWVARLGEDDATEDEAARLLGERLAPDPAALGLSRSPAFTGRLNLVAEARGVVRVDAATIHALNAVDPAITVATLPDLARVEPRMMVATVKIIPYAVPRPLLEEALALVGAPPLRVVPFRPGRVSLIVTRTPGMKESLIAKGIEAVEARILSLGLDPLPPAVVPHAAADVAAAMEAAEGDLVLLLTASATSDAADTGPAALLAAGGRLERFGMPVDPGNLLFLGRLGARPVVGLPGCVRSPALNGADWVLERLAAGIAVTGEDIARMGVGGLLKEIPIRPQPRAGRVARAGGRRRVEAILLAAGSGRRMQGRDKLAEPATPGGTPVLRLLAERVLASSAARLIVVLPPGGSGRREMLAGLALDIVEAPEAAEGMAGSLRAGIAALSAEADALVLLLGDMPEVDTGHIDRVIAAFDPEEGREICRAVDEAGRPGHPVLFGRRFFESLAALRGDRGARDIIRAAEDHVVDVPTPGRGATLDLDTPEEWEGWRSANRT